MNPIDNAIVLDEAKRYTDKKMQNVLGTERINVLIDLPLDEGHAFLERKAGLVAGTTYTVALDSGNYTAVCKRIDSNGESMLLIGNAALLGIPGMEDTGESFLIYEGYDSVTETYVTMVGDAQAGTRCKVYETIRTIDQKFLPGVCLPVVELETVFPAEGESVELSETDSSKFNAIVAAESVPFVVYGKTPEGTYMKMLMSGMYSSSMGMFGCRLLFMEYSLANVSGAWVLSSSRE